MRLAELVGEVRDSLGRVQAETNQLLLAQRTRRLSAPEAARARSARWESERLRYELQRLHDEFERLRAARGQG